MFGLVYVAAMAIAAIASGTKCAIEEQHQINKAKQRKAEGKNKYNLYTDRKGATRDLATGQLRNMDYICCEQEGQDQYLRDMYGNPVRNLSEERRQQRYFAAMEDPRRTVSLWKKSVLKHKVGREGNPPWFGDQYKDLTNGKIYVCRNFRFPSEINNNGGSGRFYMDTETGLLVREADGQIEDRKRRKYEYSAEMNAAFIEYFNKKQSGSGYRNGAKRQRNSGWDDEESSIEKEWRLNAFYCNKDYCTDEPRGF